MLPASQRSSTNAPLLPPGETKPGQPGDLPTAFGRFLLLKRLSRGGMGEIFLAKVGEIEGFEKLLIIKKILPNLVENQEFINRFVDEAQVAIKLNHANIAAVYEVGRVEGEYFLAIEYVEGRDLRRLVQRCREQKVRLPVDLCLYLGRELCAGLAYAHRRTDASGRPLELVHCDISPPNVMVSYEGEVKVIDFGIARSALRTAGSNPNMGFGKFGYMAPEQLLRGGIIDRRTDIYAAGVVLYELLTGERLYQFPDGTDYRQIARTVCQGRYTPPSQRDPALDPSLDAVVARALALSKDDRYQAAEEFRDALQARMYALNPTISADSLARVMGDLFSAEREREGQELASLRAFDVGAYQVELAGSINHTVTFARHLEPPTRVLRPPSGPSGAVAVLPLTPARQDGTVVLPPAPTRAVQSVDAAKVKATALVPTQRGAAARTRRRVLLAAGLLLGAGICWWLLRPAAAPPPIQAAAAPPPIIAEPMKPPVLTPIMPVPKEEPRRPRPRPALRVEAKKPEVAPPPPPPPAGPTPQSVEAKFQRVRREYEEFRGSFGKRLEDPWQEILNNAAMGQRDQHMDQMLNQLRADMQRVRSSR